MTVLVRAHLRELEPHGWLVGAGRRPSSRLSPRDGNGLLPQSGAKEFQTWQRFLFDHGTPKGLARALVRSHGAHGAVQGLGQLSNGELLNAAERAGFDLLLTTDRRIRYQQNLSVSRIALVVLTGSTKWTLVQQHVDRIAAAVASATLAVTWRSRFRSRRGNQSGSIHVCGRPCDGPQVVVNTRKINGEPSRNRTAANPRARLSRITFE